MGVAENVAVVRRYYAMGALNDPKRATMFAACVRGTAMSLDPELAHTLAPCLERTIH